MAKLEAMRRAASVAMGIAPDIEKAGSLSVPLVGLRGTARGDDRAVGPQAAPADMDIAVRMMSNGQAHRATPLTGALCLAVATRIPGSIPNEMARRLAEGASQIRIGHASGVIVVDARIGRPSRRPAPRRVRRRIPHRAAPVRRPRALSRRKLIPEQRRTAPDPERRLASPHKTSSDEPAWDKSLPKKFFWHLLGAIFAVLSAATFALTNATGRRAS